VSSLFDAFLSIRVRRRNKGYVAIDRDTREEHLGSSPDEAIGAAIRHCWLQLTRSSVSISLTLDLQSDKTEAEVDV
jgi:hypothetical protein